MMIQVRLPEIERFIMRTKSLPFQLEQTTRGAFLLQGLGGGMVMGFVGTLLSMFAFPGNLNFFLLFYVPQIMGVGGVIGLIAATLLWAIYRFTRLPMRLPVRISVSTFASTLLVSFVGYLLEARDPWLLAIFAGWSFVLSLPVALFVGSQLRPWEIFTYWRVTFWQNGIKERLSSSGILAIGGVLPLRLLSLSVFGCWTLFSAAIWSVDKTDVTDAITLMLGPIIYLAMSAYLTFSSPGKFVLLAIGLFINLPISYLVFFGHTIFPEYWKWEVPTILAIADTIFLSAWVAFVATRFIVNARHFLPEVRASSNSRVDTNQEHHCLGSRFLEWREHAA